MSHHTMYTNPRLDSRVFQCVLLYNYHSQLNSVSHENVNSIKIPLREFFEAREVIVGNLIKIKVIFTF